MVIRRPTRARSELLVLTVLLSAVSRPVVAATPENPFEELAEMERTRLGEVARKPEAVGPLLALLALADVLPEGRLDATVKSLLDQAGPRKGAADPLVAARARDWLARRLEDKGDDAGAATLRQPLGLLQRFWVVGPFGDGRASIDVPYPPELAANGPEVGGARTYVGKERAVSWRRAEGAIRHGALDLGALLRPDTEAAAYVLAFVRSDRAADVALRLGTPGPVKIWCNGGLVHAADQVRSVHFDQDVVGIHLRAGWNRLLVKTVVSEGAWRLFARLTNPDGGSFRFGNEWDPPTGTLPSVVPLPDLEAGARAPGVRARIKEQSKARSKVRSLEVLLRQQARTARSAEGGIHAGVDLGRYLLMIDPADRDRKEAAHAFEASAARYPTVEALMGLSSAGREEDESRRALERALVVATNARDRARVLAALGDVARDQHREAVAVERWREALVADPRWWPAALSLAGEEQSAGFPYAALSRLDSLPDAVRAIPVVAREKSRLLTALDRRFDSEGVLRALLVNAGGNSDLLHELAAVAQARGDAPESIRLLARSALLRPDLPSMTVEWARALEGARDLDGARAALEAAALRLPDEPTLAAELGKLLDRQGDAEQALKWLRTALDLRPQDPELRRYTDGLAMRASSLASGGAGGARKGPADASVAARADLPRRFAAAVPPLMAAELARTQPGKTMAAGKSAAFAEPDPAVVLLDRRAVRVHPNGLSEVFAQRVVEVRTDRGAEDNKEFLIRYTPGSEEVEILEARIFRRGLGGAVEVLEASERDDQDLSEPWYGLYYDYRAEIVRFEGLRAGDVLEVQYLVSDVSRENQLAGYFGDLQFVAESVVKRRWDYTLIGPKGRTFHFARPVVAGLEETASSGNGEQVIRFAVRDVPRIEAEPAMPGMGEVSPYLHVSTYANWDEVGTWYWRLVEEQLVPDDTVKRAAAMAIRSAGAASRSKGGPALTDLDKVRALHALVLDGTRYVGLEFGIHGFKPYKVSQVLARKFGDCKDKAALLVALLAEAGIEADMVLLRTRRGGRIAPSPASLAVFDHAIVYVPSLGLYLDGTAEFSGMRELPSQDQAVMVLRVGSRGIKLVETPVLPSVNNRASRIWNVRLKADGDSEVDEQLTIDGQAAAEWRSHYQTPGERMDRYAKVWTGRNPGARLETVDMPGIDDRNRPVTVTAKATVPRLAEPTPGGGLLLMLGARDADLVRTYARLSERRSDLVLGYPWRHEEVITYQLPAGFRATQVPEPRHIQTKFGAFDLRVEPQGANGKATATATAVTATAIKATARLDVSRERISPGEYSDFRRFLADVDAAMSERIVVGPGSDSVGVARTTKGATSQ